MIRIGQGSDIHALVEGRMEAQYEAVAEELHEVQQRLAGLQAGGDGAG